MINAEVTVEDRPDYVKPHTVSIRSQAIPQVPAQHTGGTRKDNFCLEIPVVVPLPLKLVAGVRSGADTSRSVA